MENAYQVIARKYRPQRFADVVGQEHVTQTLANSIAQNRIAHAFLFVGPRGTGKTTIARIFAKCLNATNGPRVDFSDDDPRCQEITEGRSLDVLEIDGASNRGIDDIRGLRETARYAPASSRFKIYIIDEVHMLTKEAFNALLKTLEEPPAHVKFMFATTEPEKVPLTILSRCQRFDLRRIPAKKIIDHLGYIAKQEKVRVEPEALQAIARGADGGMRDAESTLDQLISFRGTDIVEADVLAMFGLAASGQLLDLAEVVLQGSALEALRGLDELASGGKDLGRLVADLLSYFRNLLLYLVSKGDFSLLEVSESERQRLARHAGLVTVEGVTRIMEILGDCESRFRDAASRRILLEVAMLRATEVRNAVSIDVVLKQLNELRGASAEAPGNKELGAGPRVGALATGVAAGVPASLSAQFLKETAPAAASRESGAPSAPPAAAAPPRETENEMAERPNRPAASPSARTVDLAAVWAQLVEGVGRASPFTKTYLVEAHPVALVKNVLTIGFDPEFSDHLGLVDNSKVHGLLQTKLAELGHHGAQVKFIKAEAPAGWKTAAAAPPAEPAASPPKPVPATPARTTAAPGATPSAPPKTKTTPVPFNKDDFKNDPLIQKALEVFRGEIVEVRT